MLFLARTAPLYWHMQLSSSSWLLCRVVGKLEAGQYFGEYATMTGSERTATVVSTTFCELYSLSRAELDKLQKRYPELARDFQKIGTSWAGVLHLQTCLCAVEGVCASRGTAPCTAALLAACSAP
jgi:hypothetical protein